MTKSCVSNPPSFSTARRLTISLRTPQIKFFFFLAPCAAFAGFWLARHTHLQHGYILDLNASPFEP